MATTQPSTQGERKAPRTASQFVSEARADVESLGVEDFAREARGDDVVVVDPREMGYTDVAHLDGGMNAWGDAGQPVVNQTTSPC